MDAHTRIVCSATSHSSIRHNWAFADLLMPTGPVGLLVVIRKKDTQLNADRTTKLLLDVNAGIVHLQEKLHHLKAVGHPPSLCFLFLGTQRSCPYHSAWKHIHAAETWVHEHHLHHPDMACLLELRVALPISTHAFRLKLSLCPFVSVEIPFHLLQ